MFYAVEFLSNPLNLSMPKDHRKIVEFNSVKERTVWIYDRPKSRKVGHVRMAVAEKWVKKSRGEDYV